MKTICLKLINAPLVLLTTASIAQPPPPLPPGQVDVASIAASAFGTEDLAAYQQLFADDVLVYEDNEKLGTGKYLVTRLFKDWLAQRLTFSTIVVTEGANEQFVVERVDNMTKVAVKSNRVVECCYWSRAVLFKMDDQRKVKQLTILNMRQAPFVRLP